MNENLVIIASNLFLGIIGIGIWGFVLFLIYKDFSLQNKHLYAAIWSVVWAVFIFAWITQGIELMNVALVKTESDKFIKYGFLKTFSIWAYAFPAFVISVGANLFTHFIIEKTSSKA